MWNQTVARLKYFTDTSEFERLCIDLLKRSGFIDIVPRGGMHDEGIDAESLHYPDKQVFQFSIQKTWEAKLKNTLKALAQNKKKVLCQGGLLVFITNRKVSSQKVFVIRDEAWNLYRYRVNVLDQEWMRAQLELHQDIRYKYLHIPLTSSFKFPKTDYSAEKILGCFSVSDFVWHALKLAVFMHKPWSNFVEMFCTKRLLPYIYHPNGKLKAFLFPKDPQKRMRKEEIKIGPHEFKFELYEPFDSLERLPGDPKFFMKQKVTPNSHYNISIREVRGGFLVRHVDEAVSRMETAVFLLNYIGFLFNGISEHFLKRGRFKTEIEHYDMVLKVTKMQKKISMLIVKDLSILLKKQGKPNDFCDCIETIYYDLSYGFSWFISQFLEALGQKYLQGLMREGNEEVSRRALDLLDDYRVKKKYFNIVKAQAERVGLELS